MSEASMHEIVCDIMALIWFDGKKFTCFGLLKISGDNTKAIEAKQRKMSSLPLNWPVT